MIRRTVLAALAVGVEAGNEDAARAALCRADPIVRGSARRQLDHALTDAALISGELVCAADPDAVRHVQRVAALTLAGRYDVDATDRDDVAAAYRELGVSCAPGLPVATIGVLVGLGILVGLSAFAIALHSHHHARPSAPPVIGAYLTGGEPMRDRELEHLLTGELIDFVLETDRDRHGDGHDRLRALHAAALRDSRVIAAHGPALVAVWHGMLDALDHWVDAPLHSHGFRDAEAAIRHAAHEMSDELAAEGLGYYLAGDVLIDHQVAHAATFVYAVEEVVFVRAGTDRRRVLSLRRLDRLNVSYALLGRESEELGDPVVLLDQVDHFVAQLERGYSLGDDAWRSSAGKPLADAAELAIDNDLARFVDGRDLRPAGSAAEGRRGSIDRDPNGSLGAAVAASVRRHEAQHGIDLDRDPPLRVPTELAAFGGRARDPFVVRANAELSAYTSQIANDPVLPKLALWNLVNFALRSQRWGTAESYAAVIVVEGLARQFGVVEPHPVVHNGQLDRRALADLALPLASQPDEALRGAARALWRELYGEPFVAIVDDRSGAGGKR